VVMAGVVMAGVVMGTRSRSIDVTTRMSSQVLPVLVHRIHLRRGPKNDIGRMYSQSVGA